MHIFLGKVRVKKLDERAELPAYGTGFSAGADLKAVCDEPIVVLPWETVKIHTGISMEIPEGFVGLVYARSGLACKSGLAPANKVGVIDSDYRGEIIVCLHNHSNHGQTINPGDRIAQIVIAPYMKCDFEEVTALDETERGEGGFGSTGK